MGAAPLKLTVCGALAATGNARSNTTALGGVAADDTTIDVLWPVLGVGEPSSSCPERYQRTTRTPSIFTSIKTSWCSPIVESLRATPPR